MKYTFLISALVFQVSKQPLCKQIAKIEIQNVFRNFSYKIKNCDGFEIKREEKTYAFATYGSSDTIALLKWFYK